MSKPKLSREPRKAKAGAGAFSTWWYENPASIDIYVQVVPGFGNAKVTITRRQIESWLKKLK